MTCDQLALLLRSFSVKRYHTVDFTQEQTVGDHSARVAVMTMYLTGGSTHLLWPALRHDGAESEVGDVPSNAKYKYPALGKAVDEAEAAALAEVGMMPFNMTEEDANILRAADILELIIFGMGQLFKGDNSGVQIAARGKTYLDQLKLSPEVRFRIDHLLVPGTNRKEWERGPTH